MNPTLRIRFKTIQNRLQDKMRDGQNAPCLTRRISGDVTRLEAHNAAATEYDPTLGLRIKIDVESHSVIERRQGGLPVCYGGMLLLTGCYDRTHVSVPWRESTKLCENSPEKLSLLLIQCVRKSCEQTCLKRYFVRQWVSREYECGSLRTSEAGGTYYVDPGG